MKLITIDSHHFNLDKVVAIVHVAAPSGQSDNVTTDIIFDFAVGNDPYKISISKPISVVLESLKQHLNS